MLTLSDIIKQATKHYEKWLAAIVQNADAPYAPFVITRIGDTAAYSPERTKAIEAISRWQKHETRPFGLTIQLDTPTERSKKRESKICAISLETREDLLVLLDKHVEFQKFQSLVQYIKGNAPQLAQWCELHVRDIIKYQDKWPQLLEIVSYFHINSEINIPIKLLPLTLSDSKFFENHNPIICSLLDEVVPKERIKQEETSCARRYQLPEQAPMLMCFWNDERIRSHFHNFSSLAFGLEELAVNQLPCKTIIITENRTSAYQLLQFHLTDTCVIFGTGYGAELLCKLTWLAEKSVWYWGDLDTHGLDIYNRIKRYFPHIQSLMMNLETLEAHQEFHGKGEPFRKNVPELSSDEERKLFEILLKGQIRLEQERISIAWVEQELRKLAD